MRQKKILIISAFLLLAACLFYAGRKIRPHHQTKYATIEVSAPLLRHKCQNPAPPWMLRQIAQDLRAFQKGVSKKQIDAWCTPALQQKYLLTRFVVKDKTISHEGVSGIETTKIFIQSLAAFHALDQIMPLPDMDFVICFADNIDDLSSEVPGPIFLYAKKKDDDRLILLPDFKALSGYEGLRQEMQQATNAYSWQSKQNKVFWRGSTTGGHFTKENWQNFPRSRLVLQTLQYPDLIDARFTAIAQCDKDLPSRIKSLKLVAKRVSKSDHLAYKYLVDVDGNTSAYERCYWQLLCNSVMFKQDSPYMQWYYGALQPYEHFIPLQNNLCDLHEKIQWALQHDEECQKIAQNATAFVEQNLFPEDVLLYLHLVFQEYAKIFYNE